MFRVIPLHSFPSLKAFKKAQPLITKKGAFACYALPSYSIAHFMSILQAYHDQDSFYSFSSITSDHHYKEWKNQLARTASHYINIPPIFRWQSVILHSLLKSWLRFAFNNIDCSRLEEWALSLCTHMLTSSWDPFKLKPDNEKKLMFADIILLLA